MARRSGRSATQRGEEGHRSPMAARHLGVEPSAAWRPAAQRRHVRLGPGLVDEDEARRIKPSLIFTPLLAPSGDRRPELLGGQHAFFEAQTLGVDKAPDLNIIDPDPSLSQLGHKTAQCEVGRGSLQQPVAMRTRQDPRPASAHPARCSAAGGADPLHPLDRRTRCHAEPCRRGMAGHPLAEHRRYYPLTQVHRVRSRHARWPPCPADTLNQTFTAA